MSSVNGREFKGKLITIEGGDGSGKATQVDRLKLRFEELGKVVSIYDFPRYERFFGQEVAAFLRGEYGPFGSIPPFLAAMLYASDRLDARQQMVNDLESGSVVLCNRYVESNLAHGGAKFSDWEKVIGFIQKVEYMEYSAYDLPRPDLTLFLAVPPERAQRLIAAKGEREHLMGIKVDLAEADLGHQEKAYLMYEYLVENRPHFKKIDCRGEKRELKSVEEIHEEIWSEVLVRRILE